jgi:DNA-binding NarL/FixJ family response regulator
MMANKPPTIVPIDPAEFRAVVADDHPMCRIAARMAIQAVIPDADVVLVTNLSKAHHSVDSSTSLLVLDLSLPDSKGIDGIVRMLDHAPGLLIAVLTGFDTPEIEQKARQAGAVAFVSKAAPIKTLIEAFRTVLGGGTWFSGAALADTPSSSQVERYGTLTPAQRRVLDAMAGGRLNKQIAYDLNLSQITVKSHVKAILKKLEVVNRTQAVLLLKALEMPSNG